MDPFKVGVIVATNTCPYPAFVDQICNKCGKIHGYSNPPAAEIACLRAKVEMQHEILSELVVALDNAFISSWQSTARWQKQLDRALEFLAQGGE